MCARGAFWLTRPERPTTFQHLRKRIAIIIPARDEEPVIAKAVASLRAQDYEGDVHILVVDDHSSDATSDTASRAGAIVRQAAPLPSGWSGKLWALSEGVHHAEQFQPDYILLTDADIVHAPGTLHELVGRAETENLDLVSFMVKLRCQSLAERTLIPAFVYFFFQLYPPRWIASRRHRTAGAAGGCMLIRASALRRMGGIAAIRNELIDDCALARRVKAHGGYVWLGLTDSTHSIREYGTFGEIHRMISRTAFTQLHYSTLLLLGTIVGISAVYLAPPLLLLSGDSFVRVCGLAAWILMTITYAPIVRFYGQSLSWAPLLPAVALFYLVATIDSAVLHWMGRGGQWKGRVQSKR